MVTISFVIFAFCFSDMRMSPERFEHLLQLNHQRLSKQGTRFRHSIPAEERLALILRFLASGEIVRSLSVLLFELELQQLVTFIKETCIVLKEVLTDKSEK